MVNLNGIIYLFPHDNPKSHVVSNVLIEEYGYGFWINIKKEKFWFSVQLLESRQKTWKIKLSPIGLSRFTFALTGKTIRGQRIIEDIEKFTEILLKGY